MKDYKKLLEGVVKIISATEKSDIGFDNICAYIGENCPELRETEDERVKNYIISCLNNQLFTEGSQADIERKKAIAWLEKQGNKDTLIKELGEYKVKYTQEVLEKHLNSMSNKDVEQNPADKCEPRFKINDKVIHKETGKIWTIHWYLADTNSYYVIDEEKLIHHYTEDVLESAEQKPVEWSEEDEEIGKELIDFCVKCSQGQTVVNSQNDFTKWATWLTSLKNRVQPQDSWKPSDEQMRCLCEVLNNSTGNSYDVLKSLFDELKNLNNIAYLQDISFKDRHTWNPSDEQIKVCKEVYADLLSAKGFNVGTINSELNRLEEQLKKLREE